MAKSGLNFNLQFSPGKLLHGILFFTILFPFVPSLISSADTQPTFLIFFIVSIFYVLQYSKYQKLYYSITYNRLAAIGWVLMAILISVIFSQIWLTSPTLWTRILSFLQFVFAIFLAYTSTYFFRVKTLLKVFWIFSIFSVVFFLTQGLVERILIPGRTDSFEMLTGSGRGARTLSPEPSFFALHILNLYIVFLLIASKESLQKYGSKIFWLASFCLIISLSGYGFFIFLLLFFARYTKISLFFIFAFAVSVGFILDFLNSLSQFRGISLLVKILTENPSVILEDRSFLSRFGSFFAYLDNIKDNFIFGDGFTLAQGGGFVSIFSSLGILAGFFLLFILFEIFKLPKNGSKIKLILCFWFLINFFSGPIGIPIIGVILGLIFRINHAPDRFLTLKFHSNLDDSRH